MISCQVERQAVHVIHFDQNLRRECCLMGIDRSRLSTLLSGKAAGGRNESELIKSMRIDSKGNKFVTILDGNYEYTYIVIGDLQVLIGKVCVEKDEGKVKNKKRTIC